MKKIIILTLILTLLSACSFKRVDNDSYEDIIKTYIEGNPEKVNQYFGAYKFYLPDGVIIKDKVDNNLHFAFAGESMYMYLDVISHYEKAEDNFEYKLDNGYYLDLQYQDKKGSFTLQQQEDKYYYIYSYNYAKIEGYCKTERINECLINSSKILVSLKYDDKVIESLIGEDQVEFQEKNIDIFKQQQGQSEDVLSYDQSNNVTEGESLLKDEDFLLNESED